MKRLLALLLAALMLVSLAACGEKDDDKDTGKGESQTEEPAAEADGLLVGTEKAEIELGTPAKTLDPKNVYSKLTYTPQMFYGNYRLLGGDSAEKAYAEKVTYAEHTLSNVYAEKISVIPYQLTAGPHTMNHMLNRVQGRNFLRAHFYTDSGSSTSCLCEYSISGNTITLKLIDKLEYNEDYTNVRCIMSGMTFSYTFSFEGRKLTLTDGTNTVEMYTGLQVSSDELNLYADAYMAAGAEKLMNADYIYLLHQEGTDYSKLFMKNDTDSVTRYGLANFEENGLVTITLPVPDSNETETVQMVYFLCGQDGIILTDGSKTYSFLYSSSERDGSSLGGNLSLEDAMKLQDMGAEKLAALLAKKADLLTDLAAAFEAAGLSVSINKESGEITMDASVLFPVDGYEVSDEGKELLKQFMTVYCSVVFDEKYAGFVSSILVEGHTDSDGDYAYNLTLSQNRADSVKAFCLSADCGVDAYSAQLTETLEAIGNASDFPVLDGNGNEDKAASRRVAFRFIINLDN